MIDDKMACGAHYDKKKETDLLMARIGQEASVAAMERTGCHPMDFTGRPTLQSVSVPVQGRISLGYIDGLLETGTGSTAQNYTAFDFDDELNTLGDNTEAGGNNLYFDYYDNNMDDDEIPF